MEIRYFKNGDYFFPEMGLTEEEQRPVGKYGLMRQEYLAALSSPGSLLFIPSPAEPPVHQLNTLSFHAVSSMEVTLARHFHRTVA